MKIKRHDTVKILSGKDKGKTGKVLKVLVAKQAGKQDRLVVEGLNLRYKHVRPKRDGEKGQRILFPAPLAVSKVALICPKCGKPTRVAYKVLSGKVETSREKKQRVCKKCQAVI
jgi:large subunit ribosomal protein L24